MASRPVLSRRGVERWSHDPHCLSTLKKGQGIQLTARIRAREPVVCVWLWGGGVRERGGRWGRRVARICCVYSSTFLRPLFYSKVYY